MRTALLLPLAMLPIAACTPLVERPAPPAAGTATSTAAPASSAQRGLAFAQAQCAACHGVTAGASSPNPESPSFAAIANLPGLTGQSLRQYLADSHNFPAVMAFTVEPQQVDDLTAYVLTLRTPAYKPDI